MSLLPDEKWTDQLSSFQLLSLSLRAGKLSRAYEIMLTKDLFSRELNEG